MPDYTGGYTGAIDAQSERRYRDVATQRALEQLTEERTQFQQKQEQRRNALQGIAAWLQQNSQPGAPPPDQSGVQPPPPGAPSVPMMQPPGPQPGPANVVTAAAPAPAMPVGAPIPTPPQRGAGGVFPQGSAQAATSAPNEATALARMKALDKAGVPAAIGVGQPPGSGWQASPAAPPTLGGGPPPPQPSPQGDIGISAPPMPAAPSIEPAKVIDPQDLGKKLMKQGMTPLQASDAILGMWPMIEQQNKNAIEDFRAQAQIAQRVLDYREKLMKDDETRRYHRNLETARERRLEQADERQRFQEGGGTGAARERAGGGKPATGLTPEGIDAAARQYNATGQMPALGFDAASKRAILNRAGELVKEEGGDPAALPGKRAEFHSDQLALNAITKDLTSIRPFARMLDGNIGILKGLATKIPKTDVRYANKSLNWLGQNVSGDADVSDFLAQMRFVQTEAARVLNNPRLVGQLTDTARHEMEGVVDGTLSLDQTDRVLDRILSDSKRRIGEMEREQSTLQSKLRGKGGASKGADTAAPATKTVDWNDLK